jgi:hypothetical protein
MQVFCMCPARCCKSATPTIYPHPLARYLDNRLACMPTLHRGRRNRSTSAVSDVRVSRDSRDGEHGARPRRRARCIPRLEHRSRSRFPRTIRPHDPSRSSAPWPLRRLQCSSVARSRRRRVHDPRVTLDRGYRRPSRRLRRTNLDRRGTLAPLCPRLRTRCAVSAGTQDLSARRRSTVVVARSAFAGATALVIVLEARPSP